MIGHTQIDFQVLFESAPGLYLVLLPDLTIIAASDAYLKATMTAREQITGRNLFEVFPDNPDDPAATGVANLRASLNYALQNKTTHVMAVQQYDIRKPDGKFEKKFWSPLNKPILNINKEVIYIIHRVEDVTEFVQLKRNQVELKKEKDDLHARIAEKEIEVYVRAQEIQKLNHELLLEMEERKKNEEKTRATQVLLHSSIESYKGVLIFSIDRGYRYLNFNTNFKLATLQAYGIEVTIGMSLFDSITNEADREKVKHNCDRALAGESHVTIEEYGDLDLSYYETRYNPMVDEQNEIIGATVLSANVTERKKAEEQIKTLNKELEAFSYSVAHDLRSPLRIIDGYSSILSEDYDGVLDHEGKRVLSVITTNVRRMGQLIDDLLNLSRLGRLPVNKQFVNMSDLVTFVIEEQVAFNRKDRIEFKVSNLDSVSCDSNLMRHVLSNLVSNAIKYSSNKEKPIVEIGSHKNDQHVVFFVKDNGVGFDMKYADKLFEVFQRLHKATEFEGTGVGLAIVHRIISKHGGRIWAEGELGNGATFYFELPS